MTTEDFISPLVKEGYLMAPGTDVAAEARNTRITTWGAEMNVELNEAAVEPVGEATTEPAETNPAAAASEPGEVKPLTRKQCLELLAEAGYVGPTSYLMPELREIVEAVRVHADLNDQTDPHCAFCPNAEEANATTTPDGTK